MYAKFWCCSLPIHRNTLRRGDAMNTPTARQPLPERSPSTSATATSARRDYPERDFGVGYGRSSGYATTRRYAVAWTGAPRFRCR
jgi:hypothetical protein